MRSVAGCWCYLCPTSSHVAVSRYENNHRSLQPACVSVIFLAGRLAANVGSHITYVGVSQLVVNPGAWDSSLAKPKTEDLFVPRHSALRSIQRNRQDGTNYQHDRLRVCCDSEAQPTPTRRRYSGSAKLLLRRRKHRVESQSQV